MTVANLWLIGMMGSGKTAVGRRTALAVGAEYADTDEAVEARSGRSVPDLWGEGGEDAFRRIESEVVHSLASGTGRVVATGGGAVLDPANVAVMRGSGTVVWLSAPASVLARRVGDGSGRPLITGPAARERLGTILEERRETYQRAAHHTIETEGKTVEEVAEEVIRLWYAS